MLSMIMNFLTFGLLACWFAAGMALGLVFLARLTHLVVYEFKKVL